MCAPSESKRSRSARSPLSETFARRRAARTRASACGKRNQPARVSRQEFDEQIRSLAVQTKSQSVNKAAGCVGHRGCYIPASGGSARRGAWSAARSPSRGPSYPRRSGYRRRRARRSTEGGTHTGRRSDGGDVERWRWRWTCEMEVFELEYELEYEYEFEFDRVRKVGGRGGPLPC